MGTPSTSLQLPRSNPEAQGISSEAIINFLTTIHSNKLELHSFMILRHGHVVAEGWWSPYKSTLPHMLFSLSKSFTSTAIGIAVSENLLSLDDAVVSFFPEEAPDVISDHLATLSVRHLLMMGTGHVVDTMGAIRKSEDGNWVKAFLSEPVEKEPGTHFLYNNGATYMLSAIIQKITGITLLEYLKPRIFSPLGIADPTWESCPRGINIGGTGLSITTEDIARFGQFYLQKGTWDKQRILSEEWIHEATSKQITTGDSGDSDWTQGYGYQFWKCRHGAYRADGAFGQFCIVMPEQDAVIAITSGTNNTQGVMNAIWDTLLPAMNSEPIAIEDPSAAARLTEQINLLAINPPQLQVASSYEEMISGKVYKLEDNDQKLDTFSLTFTEKGADIILQDHLLDALVIHCGRGVWVESYARMLYDTQTDNAIMASFTWISENTLQLTLLFIEAPFCITIEVKVEDNTIVLKQQINISDQSDPETIIGRAI
ncbi:serine hydrolase domain-containing protein [Paenibacillus wynnii]|uniref:Beta-lactamase n=1 Tax=Paenibacillus wynnii TaxID=268407 RepID=A0A098M4C2_9BACL|nr:serine hydrolase [Paenibacillus wynnii]KGE16873.1 beta-lactamase [Paenibacillus wynnii]